MAEQKVPVPPAPYPNIQCREWLSEGEADAAYVMASLWWAGDGEDGIHGYVTINDGFDRVEFQADQLRPLRDFLNRVIEEMERVGGEE